MFTDEASQFFERQLASRASHSSDAPQPEGTIAPYATLLNGVNQIVNDRYRIFSWWSLGILALVIITVRTSQRLHAHMRHLSAMGRTIQTYWGRNTTPLFWKFKKHILYAPLVHKRHNREFRLSSAINMGTLPSRFHSIQIFLYIAATLFYTLDIGWNGVNRYQVAAELRGRSGMISVSNMIPLVIFAGRNNPLIAVLQISFDTYNLMHRWLGRIVMFEALIHTMCWAYVKHAAAGWSGLFGQLGSDPFAIWGLVAFVSMFVIFVTAFSPVRHAFYETFLDVHIIMAASCFAGTWIHCVVAKLPTVPYIKAAAILWMCERSFRFLVLFRVNYSQKGWTRATVEALPGEACRVTMHLPKKVHTKPGCHAYLRFASINPLECHPFSIAWTEDKPNLTSLPVVEKDAQVKLRDSDLVTDVSFVIGAQTGFTRKLFNKASECSPRFLKVKAVMEGPYGGHHSLDSYGHCVLFAGATGVTHQIGFVKHLINGFHDGTLATRRITLVWIVRDSEHLEWVRPWMDQVLRLPGRRDCLTIKLFITRPKNPREIVSPSNTVQMYPGRPNIKLIMESEVKDQCGAMAVTVCGPGGLADNVREAVREVQEDGVVDFIEESFTW
ncbi:hypothetical protein PZA11_000234 [Diplocarpon coronariae]|uniref:FAD-binding FR-type domain-containing protein n=1 Tax=Diplocarpon coronariae TaxID=2795749 RepID=A0A218Z193_9HELO|nr:hypothetical protein JHW43_005938 [Diplocarpon mali]OWP01474.1 hypothetical protein B2J93_706 [Marssonina coronariae]